MQVIGNIGTVVEKAISKNGREYFKFRLAENHNSKSNDPEKKDTRQVEATWFYVSAFISELDADLLAKGSFVAVTGRLEAQPYINKEGNAAVRLTILAGKVTPIERKTSAKNEAE